MVKHRRESGSIFLAFFKTLCTVFLFQGGRPINFDRLLFWRQAPSHSIPLTEDNLQAFTEAPLSKSDRGLAIVADPETGRAREVAVSLTGLTKTYL